MAASRSHLVAALALAAVGLASPAWAGRINVPCRSPSVFPDAAVNVVVLPYSAPPEIAASLESGRELARLAQAELLLSIAKFGSVGAVQLAADGEKCDPDEVLAKLLGELPGARETLRPGRAVVLLWGRIFRDEADLYIQSFVRFTRRGGPETIGVPIGDETFRVALSGQAFACVPRRISITDLRRIDEQFRHAEVLYSNPDLAARRMAIPSEGPFSYYVVRIQGDWMQVQGSAGGPGGWLPARVDQRDWSLRALLPELSFVEGVTGWLRHRVAGADGEPAPDGVLESADAAVRLYQQDWRVSALLPEDGGARPAGYQPLAVGIPLQVRALIALARPQPSEVALADAAASLARAARLVPYSADARNLEVVMGLAIAHVARRPAPTLRAAATELERALSTEPANTLVLQNLAAAYRLLLAATADRPLGTDALSAADRAEIQQRLDAIGGLLADR